MDETPIYGLRTEKTCTKRFFTRTRFKVFSISNSPPEWTSHMGFLSISSELILSYLASAVEQHFLLYSIQINLRFLLFSSFTTVGTISLRATYTLFYHINLYSVHFVNNTPQFCPQ